MGGEPFQGPYAEPPNPFMMPGGPAADPCATGNR